ncbi:MAG: APC family permease [Acidobacteriota bacterium]
MTDKDTTPQLVRGLGLLDSTFIVVGVIIGSGIFLTTGVMAQSLPSAPLLMVAWVVGGLIAMTGALTYAELGAAMPEAGGQYVYLREAYGPLSAFLFGWIMFLVYQPGSIAAVATGFSLYLGYFAPSLGTENVLAAVPIAGSTFTLSAGQVVAAAVTVFLTAMNVTGLRSGAIVQNVSTFLKVTALAALILLGFWFARGSVLDISLETYPGEGVSLLSGFGVALIAVIWSYDGFINLTFSAGEIKDPGRTLPRALVLGTAVVTVIYVLTNAVYLLALPIPEMQGVLRVADKTASTLFGPTATTFIAAAVLVSTFGSTNGTILTGARVYYAMAKDRLFFKSVARVHPQYRTPHISLWLQCLWACALALSGTFEQLFTYTIFAAALMYAAAGASVFTLRRTQPHLPRPYRVWGYPLVPGFFLVSLAAVAINSLIERPIESFSGLGILTLGIPVYFYWSRQHRAPG